MSKSSFKNILLIGLGSMGFGIGKSLLRNGFNVYGEDKNLSQKEKFIAEGGENHQVIYKNINAVIIVVLNEMQTKDILFGDNGVAKNLKKKTLVMVCTTVSPHFAEEMSVSCSNYDLLYIDAPISGGSKKSAEGNLTYMISGSSEAIQKAKPILDVTSEAVFEFGDKIGSGSAMKSINQMLAGIHIAAMAEAITFGISQGIDAKKFLEVISKCAGTSWMLENRAPNIINSDYSPKSSINIWPKDLGIVLNIAQKHDFSAPLTKIALEQFLKASDKGLGNEDDSAVAKVYAQGAGIKLP